MKKTFTIRLRTTLIFLFFFAINIFGQKVDTLFIEKYKFPLQKTKIYHNDRQKGFPSLPSEYSRTDKKDVVIKFKFINQKEYEVTMDGDGNSIMVMLGLATKIDTTLKCEEGQFTYTNIVDTLHLSHLISNSTTPYLKIDKKKFFLTSARLQRLSNDTLTKCSFDAINDLPLSIDFTFSSENFIDNKMLFILSDIYYKKNNTTYYLDKVFLIRINNHKDIR